jgi:four helix bundle protein
MALGSASELEYHLLLARDLNLIGQPAHHELSQDTTEVKRMLTALRQRVKLRTDD